MRLEPVRPAPRRPARALVVVAAALVAASPLATPPAALAGDLSIDADTFTLPNGMTVVLYEDPTLPKVAVVTWFHVGSKDERPGRTGFAHLFEHLMFMGTERVPDHRYDLILEGGGGWSNASTSGDRTNYYVVGPSALLPTMLWLEADRLDGLAKAMTQEKLDAQRDVVRNERRETENAPYGRADLRINELMFPPGHPYHHPIIGSHEDLEAATLEDVKEFFRTYYVPANATLVVAGAFDSGEIRPLVEKLLGALPATATPEPRAAPAPELTAEIRAVEVDHVEFPRLTLAWHSPAAYREGDGEMDLVAEVLAAGSASRLERSLVQDLQIAQSVVAYQWSSELSSLFLVEAMAAPGADLETIKRQVLDEIDAFVTDGPTEAELARAKAQIEASFLRRLESLPRRADQINAYRHYFGEADAFEQDLERWTEPAPEDVQAWAAEVFGPGRLDLRVYPENPEDATRVLDERPEDLAAADFTPPEVETFRLSNGIDVYAIARPGTRLFTGRVLVASGEDRVPAEQAGLADLAASVMGSGAGGRRAAEFADAVETLGANVWVWAGGATSGVGVSGISSRLDETLDLFADVVLRPNLADEDFRREKSLAIAAIRSRGDEPEALARLVGRSLLFADDDPRHRPFEGTEATVSSLTAQDVRAWVERAFRPGGARMAFAGDFDVDELRDALERRFRKWKGGSGDTEPVPVKPRSGGPRFVLVNRPDAPQTVIYATRLVPRLEGPDRAVRQAASTAFGGTYTSRVNANLREKNGYTYGAFGRLRETPDYATLSVSSSVFTDVTGKALAEMKKECDGMAASPPTDEEVTKAVESGRAELVDTAETTGQVGGTLAEIVENGRPTDAVARDLAALADVSADDVRAFAGQGLWNWSGLNVVLVGDRDAVLPQLAEAGFPAPELVDELGDPVADGGGTR